MPVIKNTSVFYVIAVILVFSLIIVIFKDFKSSGEVVDYKDVIALETVQEIEPISASDKYGYAKDDYSFEDYKVQRNESLYIILRRHGLSPRQIHDIQQRSEGVANLNRLVPDQQYRIYYKDEKPVSFVWHPGATQFVTVDWKENINIERTEIPVRTVLRETSGIIEHSLYETIMEQEESQLLGSKLANIYAWQIDFFSLRRGDHFKVVYEEQYAGEEYIGIGDVKAAEFQHQGTVYKAFYFENSDRKGFFDEEGNSLEKALLKAPFQYNQRISSGFTNNRFHPILKRNRPHHGTDYAARIGTPILAVGDGVVTEARHRGGNGNIVQVRHNNTYKSAYLHMNGFASGIRRGANVEQGQVIGYVGQTGLATGPHLCYRLYINDKPVNSVKVDLPASESLDEKYMDDFLQNIQRFEDLLDQMNLMNSVAEL